MDKTQHFLTAVIKFDDALSNRATKMSFETCCKRDINRFDDLFFCNSIKKN